MTRQALESNLKDLLTAVHLCLESRLPLSALALLYMGIDTMAWLDRAPDHLDVRRDDFVAWVDTFLLPGSGLHCSAIDLYGARCGILHSLSAESRLYRDGKAKRLYYAWGDAVSSDLDDRLHRSAPAATDLVIHINDLIAGFASALHAFAEHLDANPDKASTVYQRAGKFFANLPAAALQNAG